MHCILICLEVTAGCWLPWAPWHCRSNFWETFYQGIRDSRMIMLGFFISGYVLFAVLVLLGLGWLDYTGIQQQSQILTALSAVVLQCWLPAQIFTENPKFSGDSSCSRWCNHIAENWKSSPESYDSRDTDTSCSDTFVYLYVLDGILVSAVIWTVCYGCHHTCVVHLSGFIFSFPIYFLALLAHGNGLKLQILGDKSEEQAFDIMKGDLFQGEKHSWNSLNVPGRWQDSHWQALLSCIWVDQISVGLETPAGPWSSRWM